MCVDVRAGQSLELGGFITICQLLIYTRVLVIPTPDLPTTNVPAVSGFLIPLSCVITVSFLSLLLKYSNPPL